MQKLEIRLKEISWNLERIVDELRKIGHKPSVHNSCTKCGIKRTNEDLHWLCRCGTMNEIGDNHENR
jgi:hypothetical protein